MRGTSCISNKVAVKKDGKNDEYGTQYLLIMEHPDLSGTVSEILKQRKK